MSAQDNLSGAQWNQPELTFTVYRGLQNNPTRGRGLGMHWSASKSIAQDFAGHKGTVVHGEVPISSVETDTPTLERNEVMIGDKGKNALGFVRREKEVPVKAGAKVTVTGSTKYSRYRKHVGRKYNPPREMKA